MTSLRIEDVRGLRNPFGSHSRSIPRREEDNVFEIMRFLKNNSNIYSTQFQPSLLLEERKENPIKWMAVAVESIHKRLSNFTTEFITRCGEKHRSGKSVARVCRVLSMIHLPALFECLILFVGSE